MMFDLCWAATESLALVSLFLAPTKTKDTRNRCSRALQTNKGYKAVICQRRFFLWLHSLTLVVDRVSGLGILCHVSDR
ncbi:uncharacterized protein B0J16DRAFT_339866 [Fusarium flagelliforme]|uniref:uncharacterized protein n=1 Tax=Fusarium flagelliforme TaxID=2675880 RepID=UPI001E8CB507|nr:uncharacterized protein B0J16DRAFT_339866 [Fusarium flagelliforme]KAH7189552.1 hypothetical protein B0J16DRAFT_339866 [Fusarium flagelliforme]